MPVMECKTGSLENTRPTDKLTDGMHPFVLLKGTFPALATMWTIVLLYLTLCLLIVSDSLKCTMVNWTD